VKFLHSISSFAAINFYFSDFLKRRLLIKISSYKIKTFFETSKSNVVAFSSFCFAFSRFRCNSEFPYQFLNLISALQKALVTIKDVKVTNNEQYGIFTVNGIGKKDGETAVNASFVLKRNLEKTLITVKVDLDQRELFRATFDGEKTLRGFNGSAFFRHLSKNFLNALDFDPTFPIKSVRKSHYLFRKLFWFLSRETTRFQTSKLLAGYSRSP